MHNIRYFVFILGFFLSWLPDKTAFSQCPGLPPILSLGSNKFPNRLCSPVTADLRYDIQFASAIPTGATLNLYFFWGDGTTTVVGLPTGNSNYSVTRTKAYPLNSDCEYLVTMQLRYDPDGPGGPAPNTFCSQSTQQQKIASWRTDAFNGGNVRLVSPTTGTTIHEVCEGVNINVIFNDASNWNCDANYDPAPTPPVGTVETPNTEVRWQQIVYNTPIGGPKIPNVSVGGTPVTGPGGVDIIANYQDPRGVFRMDPPVVIGDPRRRPTLAITAPGGFGPGFPVAGQEFRITLRYWNYCNPYDDPNIPGPPADPINGDFPPVESTAIIRIVASPAMPVVNDRDICEADSRTLTVSNPIGGLTYRWWTSPAQNTQVATGTSFTPGNGTGAGQILAGQRKHWWVTAENAGGCRSAPDEVILTRRPALPQPDVISGPANVCPNSSYTYTVPGGAPTPVTINDVTLGTSFQLNTEYFWTVPAGWTITGGQGTDQITVTSSSTVSSGSITVQRRYVTTTTGGSRCGVSRSMTVNVRARPTVNITPDPADVCEGNTITLNGNPSTSFGTISLHTWGGSSMILDDPSIQTPTVEPSTSPGSYNLTYVATADFGGGVFCSSLPDNSVVNVFVRPLPANAGPDQNLCFAAPPLTANLAGSNPSPGTGTWTRVSGPGAAPVFIPNANTPNASVTVFANGIHTFRWTVVNGACSSFDDVVIDFGTTPPASDAGLDQDVCGLSATLNGNDPLFATGTWSQTAGPGTSSFSPNANTRNATVTVSVPGTYTFRWRLTSGTCPPSDDDVVIIFRNPPTVTAPPNFTHCLNNPPTPAFYVNLSGTFGGGASQARWEVVSGSGTFQSSGGAVGSFDNTNPVDDVYQPSAADFTAGSVQLRLITDDPPGACTAVSAPVTITFDRLPSPAAAGPDFSTCDAAINLNATPANNGGTGTWSVGNAVYYQTFTYPNGTGLSGPNPHPTLYTHPDGWTITAPNANTLLENNLDTGDYLRVESGVMQAHDVNDELVWRSPVLNITALPNISISIQMAELGVMEANDYIRAYYRLNGGPEVLIGEIVDDSPVDGAFNTFTVSGLSGTSLQIVVRVRNDAADERHRFDNVFVSSGGVSLPEIADINSPTTSVTNLPVGNTTFTWTVTSALGVCSASSDQVVITRHASPVNNNLLPELCEDAPTLGTATVTLAYLNSLNDAITGIPGSANRTIQFFTDPARTIPYPPSSSLSTSDKVYTIVTRTDVIPNCQTVGELTFTINSRPAAINQNPEFCEDLPVGSNTRAGINLTSFNNAVKNNVGANTVAWFLDVGTTIPVPDPTNVTANDGTTFFARVTDVKGCTNVAQVEIKINPRPGPNPIIGPSNVCADPSAINLYQVTTINTGATYSWNIPDPPFDRFAGGDVNDFFVLLAFPVIVNPGQDISFIETSSKGCQGLPNVLNITVEGSPPPIDITGPSAVCENEAGVVYSVPNLANTTYSWTVPPGSAIIAGQGTFQITVNFGTNPGLITVTPTTTTGCAGNPDDHSVAINPRPSLNPLSNTVCSDNIAGITLSGPGAVTFNITNVSVPPGLSPASRPTVMGALSGEIFNDVFTNTTGGNLTVQYTVVPVSAQNCTGPAQIVNLTVRPEPILAAGLNDVICSRTEDVNIVLTVAPGSVVADQFEITSINTNGLTATAGNPTTGIFPAGVLLDDRWQNMTGAPVTVEYFVRPINSATGCVGDPPVPVTVTVNPEPVVNSPTSETICSGNSPTITLTATIPGSSFNWIVKNISGPITGASNGTGATITNVLVNNGTLSGSVTYEVSANAPGGLGGCPSAPVDVVITVDPAPTANNINQTVCSDNPGGNTFLTNLVALQPSINSGGGVTFSWFEDLALTMPIGTPSSYTLMNGVPVYVQVDNGQCTKVASVTFVINPRPSVTAAVTSNYNGFAVSCTGSSDGQITATPANGVGPYQFSINGGVTFFASPVFNGLSAAGGPYVVRVRDSNNCTNDSPPLSLSEPLLLSGNATITSNYNGQHVSCNTASDGIVTVVPSGGAGGYSFKLLELPGNTSGDASGIYTGLRAGTYTFLIKDGNNCQFTTNPITVTEPSPVTATATLTSPVTCNGNSDGVITVTGGGGTLVGPNYQFTLNQPPGTVNTTGVFGGLAAGNYTVTVQDDNGCTQVSNTVNVPQPPVLTIFASVTSSYNGAKISCAGANDAQVTGIANGGNGGYSYVLIQDPGNLTGVTDGSFENLGPGNYSIRVTDAGGCQATSALVNVTEPAPVTASGFVSGAISCFGGNDGQITISANGGTGAYTFTQIAPPGPSNGSGIFSGLSQGTYDFQVRDLNNCSVVTQVTINNPPALTASATVTSNYNGSQVTCNGASDGIITVTASGGTGLLQYVFDQFVFSNTTGQFSGVFTGVPAGTNYTFTVRDSKNCTVVTAPINVTQPAPVSGSGTVTSNYNGQHITCVGATDGIITVSATGGTGAYSYRLDQDPSNSTGNVSGVYTGVGAGIYTVTIRDVNNCFVVTAPITVTPPPNLNASLAVTSNYNGRQISCNGASDGVLTTSASGGVPAYSYVLLEIPGNTTGATSGVFTGVPAGTYTVRVTDQNGCQRVTSTVTVSEPSVVTASASVTSNYNGRQLSCFGASDGRIQITAGGGTPGYSFSFNEIPANTTGDVSGIYTGIPAGSYTFTVRDINNCTVTTVPVSITPPPALSASAAVTSNYNGSQVSCNGASDGVITITAGGGTGALNYVFDQIPGNTTGQFSGVFIGVPAGGSYTFTVSDANNCQVVTAPISVSQPPALGGSATVTSNYNGQHIRCVGSTDGEITVTASGGTGTYTYKLDQSPTNTSGDVSGVYTGVAAGTYTITIRDVNNCFVVTAPVTVIAPPNLTATLAVTSNYNGRQISCNGANDGVLTTTAGGGVPAYSYVLVQIPGNTTGAASGVFTGVPAGTYTVQVTDLNGCQRTTTPVTVTEPAVLTASATVTSNYNGQQISCFGASDAVIRVTANGGTTPFSFSFVEIPGNTTGNTSGTYTGIPPGTYTFTVTDVNNCNVTTTPVTVTQPSALTASAAVTSNYNGQHISCNGASDGIITITSSGGTGSPIYVFDQFALSNQTGRFSGVFTGVPEGTNYTFTVTDVNGCSVVTAPISVSQPHALSATAAATSNFNGFNISCFNNTDGVLTVTFSGGTGPLTFTLLENPGNTTGQTSGIFTGLSAGTYRVRINDVNGCLFTTAPAVVTQPNDLSIAIAITSDYNGFHLGCFGASDAQVSVTSISGGAGGYSYTLFRNNSPSGNNSGQFSGIFNGLNSGLYDIDVTDANGCVKKSLPVVIIDPLPLFEGILGFDKSMCVTQDDPTPFIEIAPAFGSIGNYTYQWQQSTDGINFVNIAGATAATYDPPPTLTVKTYYRRIITSGCETKISNVVSVTVNPLPTATLSASHSPVCEGDFFILTFSFSNGTAPFFFDYNDGTTFVNDRIGADVTPVPILNYTDTKTYTLTELRDFNGCYATVLPPPLTVPVSKINAAFTVLSPPAQCSGSDFTFQWTVDPNIQYTWIWSDGNTDVIPANSRPPGLNTITHNFVSFNTSTNTNFPVILSAVNTVDGCGPKQTNQIVTIYPNILINVFPNKTEMCSGEQVTINNPTMGGNSHSWQVIRQSDNLVVENRGPFVAASNQVFTIHNNHPAAVNPDIFNIVYTVSNSNCTAQQTIPIRVYREIIAGFDEGTVPPFVGGNATVVYTNTSQPIDPGNFSYSWEFGLAATPASASGVGPFSVDYSSPGMKTVRLTAVNVVALANNVSCSSVFEKDINILMPPLVAAFTYEPQSACFPTQIRITSNSATGDEFQWQVVDQNGRTVATANIPLPVFDIVNPGAYTIFLTTRNSITGQVAFADNSGTGPNSMPGTSPVQVYNKPIATFQARPTTLFVPDTELVTFNFSTPTSPPSDSVNFWWNFGDNNNIVRQNLGDPDPTYRYAVEGRYTIRMVMREVRGNVVCTDTATQEVIAREGGLVKVPNAFTPDPTGPNGGIPGSGASINDVFLPIVRGINVNEPGTFLMQIFDRWGNLIFESRNDPGAPVPIRGWDGYDRNGRLLPAGVYVYRLVLRLADGQQVTQIGDVTLIR